MKTTTTKQTPTGRAMARAEAGRRPAPPRASATHRPLSAKQKSSLCQLARRAFDHLDGLGLIDLDAASDAKRFAAWRAEQQIEATGQASLTTCGNGHYRPLKAHYLNQLGEWDVAFATAARTGKVWQAGAEADTHERRDELRALILKDLLDHGSRCMPGSPDYDAGIAAAVEAKGGLIRHGYVLAIAKAKCQGKALDALDARQLEQIHHTLRNRIAAREGRGKTANRNKTQRAKQS